MRKHEHLDPTMSYNPSVLPSNPIVTICPLRWGSVLHPNLQPYFEADIIWMLRLVIPQTPTQYAKFVTHIMMFSGRDQKQTSEVGPKIVSRGQGKETGLRLLWG